MDAGRRIAFLAVGTTGDVVPLVALAHRLRTAGLSPRVVTHARFAALAEKYDLECVCVPDDPLPMVQRGPAQNLFQTGGNPLTLALAMRSLLANNLESILAASLPAMEGAEVIIASNLGMYVAISLGEKLGIPVIPALLQPTAPTGRHANPFVSQIRGGLVANRLSHGMFWRGTWLLFRPLINRARRRVLNLPPLPARPIFPGHLRAPFELYGYSAAVVPTPPDWPPSAHVTGYWFLPPTPETAVSPKLRAFVEADSPPICIGFGSMTEPRARELTQIALEAARRTRRRVVLLAGWAELGEHHAANGSTDRSVFVAQDAPHDWLFPKATALVHHAGAGTTAAALRAGRPSVTVPFFGDQFFWARRLHDLGAGTAPLPRRGLTVERLARAIDLAANEPQLARRAKDLRDLLAREDGVASAVDALRPVLAS